MDGTYYVHQQDVGLMRMVGDDLQLIPGSEQFANERLHVFLPLAASASEPGGMLFGTFNRGLFRYDGQAFTPFRTEADDYLQKQTLYKGALLPDGTFALTTHRRGRGHRWIVAVMCCAISTKPRACPATTRSRSSSTGGGIVWLGLEGHICAVETPSPLSRFDLETGLLGGVTDLVRYKGVIYVGTSVGLFYMDRNSSFFKPVTGFTSGNRQVQGLLSTEDYLLVAFGSGIHQVEGTTAKLVKANIGASYSSNVLRVSLQDNHRVWVGLEDGLAALYRQGSGWIDEGRVEGLHETVSSIVESEPGVLWMGTNAQGIIRVRFKDASLQPGQIERFGKDQGLGRNSGAALFAAPGGTVAVTPEGAFRFDEATDRFVPDTRWKDVAFGGTQGESAIAEDHRGDVWVNLGLETGVFRRQSDGTYRADKTALLRFSDLAVVKDPGRA